MNLRLRNIVFLLFFGFICFHFLIPTCSHIHLCCETLKIQLCTQDEKEHKIEHILNHHFHQKNIDTHSLESLNKKPISTEKHIHFSFLSSGDKNQTKDSTPHQDFLLNYFNFSYSPAIIQFTPLTSIITYKRTPLAFSSTRSPPIW